MSLNVSCTHGWNTLSQFTNCFQTQNAICRHAVNSFIGVLFSLTVYVEDLRAVQYC